MLRVMDLQSYTLVALSWRPGLPQEQLTTHPQMCQKGHLGHVGILDDPEELPAPGWRSKGAPGQPLLEVVSRAPMPCQRTIITHGDGQNRCPGDRRRKTRPYDIYFGELRHAR